MKYDTQLSETQKSLPTAQNILIALPNQVNVDELASGLALFLSLQQAGKKAYLVTEGIIKVGHSNLYGVGEIQSKLSAAQGGDFTLVLGGVVAPGPDGKPAVPAVEKLDYFPLGNDLNLVFKVLPGQKFEPTFITPRHEAGGYQLIFVIGATSLNDLGSIYTINSQVFVSAQLVNIDNKANNTQFGSTNVVDPSASSLSEMIAQVIASLGLPLNQDIASNILAGIYETTNNLQSGNLSADTFEAVSQALRLGGQKPSMEMGTPAIGAQTVQEMISTPQPFMSIPQTPPQGFDLTQVTPVQQNTTSSLIKNLTGINPASNPADQSSPEEVPVGEEVVTPEADWLTPKIFKGKGGIG